MNKEYFVADKLQETLKLYLYIWVKISDKEKFRFIQINWLWFVQMWRLKHDAVMIDSSSVQSQDYHFYSIITFEVLLRTVSLKVFIMQDVQLKVRRFKIFDVDDKSSRVHWTSSVNCDNNNNSRRMIHLDLPPFIFFLHLQVFLLIWRTVRLILVWTGHDVITSQQLKIRGKNQDVDSSEESRQLVIPIQNRRGCYLPSYTMMSAT